EHPAAAIRVRNTENQEASPLIGERADVVVGERCRARRYVKPDEFPHPVGSLPRARASHVEALPGSPARHLVLTTGPERARTSERDLRAIVGIRRCHSAGGESAGSEIHANDVPPEPLVLFPGRSAVALPLRRTELPGRSVAL